MNSVFAAGVIFSIVVNHLCYQAMLKTLSRWGVSVDRKSWGMGFNKNIPAYIRELRHQGEHFDGLLCTLFICIILGMVCVVGWLYLNVYILIFP